MTKALIRLFIKNAEDTRSAAVREQYGILSGAVGLACNLFLFAQADHRSGDGRDFQCGGRL